MKPPKHHRIRVTEEKLGRQKALGMVDDPPYKKTIKIKIDSRLNELHKLDTLVHELIHLFDPDIPETRVRKMGTYRIQEVKNRIAFFHGLGRGVNGSPDLSLQVI